MVEFGNTSSFSEFNIIEFAKKVLEEVESIRSYSDISSDNQVSSNIPNESRLNAFFRLVGLPMFLILEDKNDDGESASGVVSPGFSGGHLDDFNIKDIDNISDMELGELLTLREDAFLSRESAIGTPELNRSMTLAISDPIPITPDLPDRENSHKGSFYGISSERTTFKMLTPLVAKYKKVLPIENELARPFATKEERSINNTTELRRPFIEMVMRIRLITATNANNAAGSDKIEEQLNAIKASISSGDFNTVINNLNKILISGILEKFVIEKLMKSLAQLSKKVISLIRKQDYLLKQDVYEVNVKTSSAKSNLFSKLTDVSTDLNLRENSELGRKLESLKRIMAREDAFLSLLPSDDTVDENSYTKNALSCALFDSFVDLLSHDTTEIKKSINRIEGQIQKSKREIDELRLELDLITGEFSGLSMIDIIAVIIGLFLIPLDDLMALVDAQVLDNMKQINSLKSIVDQYGVVSTERSMEAVLKLESMVYIIFDLFNLTISSIMMDKNKKPIKSSRSDKKKKVRKSHYSVSEVVSQMKVVKGTGD
jgi:hypothetical protein